GPDSARVPSPWTTSPRSTGRRILRCARGLRTVNMFQPIAILIFLGLVACGEPEHAAPSVPPRVVEYKVVEEWTIPNGGFGRVIVIPDTAATERALRALGEELKYDTRSDRNAFISILNDARAAGMRHAAMRDDFSK